MREVCARMFSKLYILLRRAVRGLVIRLPLVDRTLGRVLRRWERKHISVARIAGVNEGGVVEVDGLRIQYRPEDAGVIAPIRLYGCYEPETTRAVRETLEPGMGFVDLGAHIGYFSLLAGRAVGEGGRVYAFEPMPSTRALLEKNIEANGLEGSIEVVPYAVHESRRTLRFATHPEASDSAKVAAGQEANGSLLDVEAIALDDYFAQRDWPRVDLVKMDVEGCETAALSGMRELSARNADLRIIFEFNDGNFRHYQLSPADLFDVLAELGFRSYRLLWRKEREIRLPEEFPELTRISKIATLNILAQKTADG